MNTKKEPLKITADELLLFGRGELLVIQEPIPGVDKINFYASFSAGDNEEAEKYCEKLEKEQQNTTFKIYEAPTIPEVFLQKNVLSLIYNGGRTFTQEEIRESVNGAAEQFSEVFDVPKETIAFFIGEWRNRYFMWGHSAKGLTNEIMPDDLIDEYGIRDKIKWSVLFYDADFTKNRTNKQKEKSENELTKFLKEHPLTEFQSYMESRVKGQEELKKITTSIYYYLQCRSRDIPCNTNAIIAAPSGSGKTETYRALRDYFKQSGLNIPVLHMDLTMITQEGFKGQDTNSLVMPLLEEGSDGTGIIFLDEFDKKLLPSYSSQGENINAAVQSQLLTMIEGRIIHINRYEIDTNKTMFVGLGSFDEYRKHWEDKRGLGFGETLDKVKDHYTPLTKQDMIKTGASYELLGRFQILANYGKLSENVVDNIIDEEVKRISKSMGHNFYLSESFRKQLHGSANGKYGCREIKNILLEKILPIYGEIMTGDRETKKRYTVK